MEADNLIHTEVPALERKSFLERLIDDATDKSAEIDMIYFSDSRVKSILDQDMLKKEDSDVSLRGEYNKIYDDYSSLLKAASAIDHIDMFLGPIQTALVANGSEMSYSAYKITKYVEIASKTLFALWYMAKTNDKNSPIGMVINESVAVAVPYCNMINIFPLYKYLVRKKIRQEAAQQFLEVMHEYGQDAHKGDENER
ncbi:MAG: hypothetical protein KKE20_05960 [Nanoarchaeota archaeon]|nr:hypothetical protein [Nanoarchaeota archaeon]